MSSESQPKESGIGPPKLRGLWEVMYTDVLSDHVEESPPAAPPAEQVVEPEPPPPASEPEPIADEPAEPESKPHRPHGLWDVMYTDVLSAQAPDAPSNKSAPTDTQP